MRGAGIRLLLIGGMELLLLLVALRVFGEELEAWRAAARYSARVSLALFALIVVADGAPRGGVARVAGPHRYALLAVNHVIHFGFLATYVVRSEAYPPVTRLLGGMLAYVFIVVMPWLHARHRDGLLTSRAWRRLEVGYQLYVGFVFVMTYLPRVFGDSSRFGGEHSQFVLLFAFLVGLGIWRIAVALLTARGILRRHDDPV